jgi:hypothetical protein
LTAIPLADSGLLEPLARRTLLVRAVLAALVVAAIAAAAVEVRSPRSQTVVALPPHADTIVVLDLSASIGSDTYSRIGATLSALARSKGRYGLVVFSGQAYEALPPGAPAEDLAPLVRYFVPRTAGGAGFAATYPRNPWTDSFSAGTRISAGLELAHRIAVGEGLRRPVVVLVSDLDDDPADLQRTASIVLAYRRDGIPLRIVGLNPSADAAAFFQRIAGPATPIVQAGAETPGPRPKNRTPFPAVFFALAISAAALLAVHELWAARLEWEPAR